MNGFIKELRFFLHTASSYVKLSGGELCTTRDRVQKRRVCSQLGSKAAVYSIVNEHLRTTLGAKRGLFAKVSSGLADDAVGDAEFA